MREQRIDNRAVHTGSLILVDAGHPFRQPAAEQLLPVGEGAGVLLERRAALLLDRLAKRRAEGMTTPKQIRFLENKGFLHVGQWQFDTAKRMIDRIAANGWRIPAGIVPAEYQGA